MDHALCRKGKYKIDRLTMTQILQKTKLCFIDPSESKEDARTIRKDVVQQVGSSPILHSYPMISSALNFDITSSPRPSLSLNTSSVWTPRLGPAHLGLDLHHRALGTCLAF